MNHESVGNAVEELERHSKSLRKQLLFLCKKLCQRNVLIALSLGQTLSLLICGTAVTSGLLQESNVQIPTAQSFFNYLLLGIVYTPLLACRRGEDSIVAVVKARGLKYLLLAFIDVEANYLVVKAYHYTTVTSVQLLDCFTIPTVLVLSFYLLRVRYRILHIAGVVICLAGVAALIITDYFLDRFPQSGSNKLLGDILILIGAMLYGVSNVGQEYVIRSFDRIEFLGMLGLFASCINGVQFALLERQEVAEVDFLSHKIWLPLLGFNVCLFTLYSLMPVVMKATSATSVNLNLLSADFYALLFGVFLFHYKFHMLYFVAFFLIVLGTIVYSIRAPPVAENDASLSEVEALKTANDGDTTGISEPSPARCYQTSELQAADDFCNHQARPGSAFASSEDC